MSANATDPTAPGRIEHLVNFPACGVGVPKSIRGGGLLFNALVAQSQGRYARFHYVYAGLHGLPAEPALRAAAQAVFRTTARPRWMRSTSRTNCVSTACCGRSGTTPWPDLAEAFPVRSTTKPPGKNARRRCGFCWTVESLRFITAQLITGTKLYLSRSVSTKLRLRSIVLCHHDSFSSEKMLPSSA